MERLAAFLASLCLFFFLTTVGLGGYLAWSYRSLATARATIASEEASAAARDQLREELLTKENALTVMYPHADARIGFVMNAAVKRAALWGGTGGNSYKINSFGLRGEEINPIKPIMQRRIVIVTDSWLWGFGLPDEHRIDVVLKRMLDEHYPGNSYTILIVGMPAWNVENEAAFLDAYKSFIQADMLVWTLAPNDIWDEKGVVPPGILASRPARLTDWLCPESNIVNTGVPSAQAAARWRHNIDLINRAQREHHAPVIALYAHEHRGFVSFLRRIGRPEFPIFMTPKEFQEDLRWPLKAGVDVHPTAWATRLVATDIFGRLVKHGHLPPAEFSDEEQRIILAGERASSDVSGEQLDAYLQDSFAGLPSGYGRDAPIWNDGIYSNWQACPQGRLMLKVPANHGGAEIAFEEVRTDTPGGNRLRCRAVDQSEATFEGVTDGARCRIALPRSSRPRLIDFYWFFDKHFCANASDCFSAKFVSLVATR